MKRLLTRCLLSACLVANIGSSVAATSNIAVRASVKGTCVIVSTSDILFGNLSAASNEDAVQRGSVTFWCSKGTNYTFHVDEGLNHLAPDIRRMKHSGSPDMLPYHLATYAQSGTGVGPAPPVVETLTATVQATDIHSVTVGDYADTLTVTVEP